MSAGKRRGCVYGCSVWIKRKVKNVIFLCRKVRFAKISFCLEPIPQIASFREVARAVEAKRLAADLLVGYMAMDNC